MIALKISLTLGVVTGLANLFGASIVSARAWSRAVLGYFIALGAGFMMATALTEMVPESLRLAPVGGAILILVGYFIVHFFEHAWPAHFHFGEEVHPEEFLNQRVAYTALAGLLVHTFFGGVAIVSGYLISGWLGTVIFGATILHNVPEGFTISSVMVAAGKSKKAGLKAAAALGLSRIAGMLAMGIAHEWVSYGLALSAGVTLYVAASDLIPEVNKIRSIKITLTVGAGVAMVVLMKLFFFS